MHAKIVRYLQVNQLIKEKKGTKQSMTKKEQEHALLDKGNDNLIEACDVLAKEENAMFNFLKEEHREGLKYFSILGKCEDKCEEL